MIWRPVWSSYVSRLSVPLSASLQVPAEPCLLLLLRAGPRFLAHFHHRAPLRRPADLIYDPDAELEDTSYTIPTLSWRTCANYVWVPDREESMHITFHSCDGFGGNR
ncbi:hypothetical protein CALVIDRAFT_32674 [Calocera viscosa TUFC12733]|uniref:Uncharacterized protein n=1 Tax=Calocera viscosa (strain TUFC12733) TaxID=1330018 RepID=A0A167FR79_CALVF|nr:hypothetical protein CALVIDRAFT_32674 [Calocera viscosa TUFC12733]